MENTELIVMLTWHDVTVENAKEIFWEAKDAPAKYWGFKDVGLPTEQMKDLVRCMKENGKTTFMECLAHTEEELQKGIDIALECGFDVFLGGHYFEKTERYLAEHGLKHLPFVGKRYDHMTHGKLEDLVAEAKSICKTTAYGINLATYRWADGKPEELFCAVRAAIDKPLSVAGSVSTYEQIDFLKKNGAWAFTIGGAFFEKKFGETFSEQIAAVSDYLKK